MANFRLAKDARKEQTLIGYLNWNDFSVVFIAVVPNNPQDFY